MPRGLLLPISDNRFLTPYGQNSQAAGLDAWYPVNADNENTFWHNVLLVGSGVVLTSATRAFRPEIGLGYSFDGSNSRGLALNNGSTPETASWTFTAWIILAGTSSASGVAIIGHASSDSGAGSWSTILGYRNAVLDGYFFNGSSRHCTGTTTLTTGVLYHVAFTADTAANIYKVYLNGVDDTATPPSTTTAPSAAVNRLGISLTTSNNTGNNGFQNRVNGVLGDLRRYRRALSPQEIWQLWAAQSRFALYEPVRAPSRVLYMSGPLTTVIAPSATQAQSGSVDLPTVSHTLNGTQEQTGSVTEQRLLEMVATQAQSGVIIAGARIPTAVSGSQAQSGSIIAHPQIGLTLSGDQAQLGSMSRNIVPGLTASQGQDGALSRRPSAGLVAAQAQAAEIRVASQSPFIPGSLSLLGIGV